jgi:hypothetical protein
MMGERHYSTQVSLSGSGANVAVGLMTSAITNRTPVFDDRRLPDLIAGRSPQKAHFAMQDAFVRTLRMANGPLGFGEIWASGGDSFGLVIYVVNHDHYGGQAQEGFVGMSVGGSIVCSVVPSMVPGLFDVDPVPVSDEDFGLSEESSRRGFRQPPISSLADVLAHELAHASPIGALNDEYGGKEFSKDKAQDVAFAESAPNTQVLAAASVGTAIQSHLLKWNWERVEAAAEIKELIDGGTQLIIKLNAESWARWPSRSVGRRVLLRERGTLSAGVPKSDLLVIQALDPFSQALHVAPGTIIISSLITVFGNNRVVVLPVLDAAKNVRRLVDPHVIAAMASGPFMRCSTDAHPVPDEIPGFRMPANKRLIAAFESGASFTWGVIRPSADCKLRTAGEIGGTPVDFCFVCQYTIVDTVDPSAHGELDRKHYPR